MVTAITALVKHGTALDKIMAVQYSSDSEQQKSGVPPSSSEPNNNGTRSTVMHQTNGTQTGMPSMIRNQSGGQILSIGGGNPNRSRLETVIYSFTACLSLSNGTQVHWNGRCERRHKLRVDTIYRHHHVTG